MATRRSEGESGSMSEDGAAANGAIAEQPYPRVKASQFRAAYEALIEPLINATIKVAEAETEHQSLRAQIGSLEAQIVSHEAQIVSREAEVLALQARLAAIQAERAQLAEQLQAVYQSHSWRVTEPLRRAISGDTAIADLRTIKRPAVAARFAQHGSGDACTRLGAAVALYRMRGAGC